MSSAIDHMLKSLDCVRGIKPLPPSPMLVIGPDGRAYCFQPPQDILPHIEVCRAPERTSFQVMADVAFRFGPIVTNGRHPGIMLSECAAHIPAPRPFRSRAERRRAWRKLDVPCLHPAERRRRIAMAVKP